MHADVKGDTCGYRIAEKVAHKKLKTSEDKIRKDVQNNALQENATNILTYSAVA